MSDLIDVLLAESELDDDLGLRDLLDELEREATAVRPMPSAALREVLSGSRVRRRRFARRGTIIAGVTVIGVLGLGVGAAAASPDVRSAFGAGVAVIGHLFQSTQKPPAPEGGVTTPPPTGHDSAQASPSPSPSPSDGGQVADDSSNDGDGVSGADSSGSNSSGSSSSSSNSSGDDKSDGSNSGSSNSGSSNSGKGNGKGNQSGHGNGKGQGNGGPAPTP